MVLVILDPLLAGSESEFEPPQTFIGKGRPAQMQDVKSIVYTSFDSVPQQNVVGSQLLRRIFRGAELVEGLPAMMKEDPRGQRFVLPGYGCDKPVPLRQYVPSDILKKSERLRRQSMTPPCCAVQRVKGPNRVQTVAEFEPQPRPNRLQNASPRRTVKTLKEFLLPVPEVNHVAVKNQRWRGARHSGSLLRHSRDRQFWRRPCSIASSYSARRSCFVVWSGKQTSVKGSETPRHPVHGLETSMTGNSSFNCPSANRQK